MNRFVTKLFLFLLPVLFALAFLEYKLSFTPNSYKIKRAFLEAQLGTIKILVLGSSETQRDILPGYFSYRAFNLANVAQTLFYDKELTCRYIDKMPQLHTVIITLNFSSLFYELSDTRENWRDYYYYRFWDIAYPKLPLINMKKYSLIALYSWPEVRKIIKTGFENDYTKGDKELGYDGGLSTALIAAGGRDQSIIEKTKSSKATILALGGYIKENRFNENYTYLNALIDSLSRRQIKVLLISTPLSKELTGYINNPEYVDDSIFTKYHNTVNNICKKYGCKYYDFSNDAHFTTSDFNDDSHLNYLGAIKFSKILDTEVVKPDF